MNENISNSAILEKLNVSAIDIWTKLGLIACPLWLTWILFDYYFANQFYLVFMPFRILCSVLSLIFVLLIVKTKINFGILVGIYYFFYMLALTFMFLNIEIESFTIYFVGFQMIIIVFYFLATYTFQILYVLTAQTVSSFLLILVFSKPTVGDIMANGGFAFSNVIIISIFIGYANIKRVKKQVVSELVLRKTYKILEAKNSEILDSISYAKRIQSAILPQPKLVKEFLEDSFILYKPKDIVAGDFYWLEIVEDNVLFAAADCTGHGVPGAMVSVVCNNGLNRAVREHKLIEPDQILNKTRELVIEEFEKSDEEVNDGMDISLCVLNLETFQLKWAGANNPLWILRNGQIIEYKGDKQPIGKHYDSKPFSLIEVQLEKNDIIYIFTDGFQDQFGGAKEKKFRAAKMKELLLSLIEKSMEEQRIIIDETFEKWKGELEQVDDVCVIGVRINNLKYR
jgi:serine phosphatase RsbU (regulator of sigma subunit)